MLIAVLGRRKASIKRPVGMSKVLIIESSDVATSHLESGENAWSSFGQSPKEVDMYTYNV